MKKLLLGVITFALIITSCNKYADDFQALKDSIAALDTKVSGVIQLQTDLTSVKATLASLTTAVAALPTATVVAGQFTGVTTSLAAVATKIDAITTTLNTVATTGTATKSVVDALTVTLAKVVSDKALADAALNTKLDALKAEVKLAITDGNAASDGKLALAQTAITNAIAASILTNDLNVKARIDAAQLAINAVTTASNTDLTTKLGLAQAAVLAAITTSQAAIELSVNGNVNTQIAALQTALQAVVVAENANTVAAVNATIDALIGASGTDATANTIKGLQLALAAAKAEIDVILASTAMYNGDVVLTVDADVDFFLPKLSQLPIVNGSVIVNPTLISAGKRANLATILSKIGAVIGVGTSVTITNTVAADAMLFTNMTSIKGNLTVTSVGNGSVSLPVLASVGGTYTNTGANALEPALVTVGADLVWNFDGDFYQSATLASVGGNMILTPYTTTGSTIVGTLNVLFPAATVVGSINGGVLTFPSAVAIDVKSTGAITAVTAVSATSVKLRNATYAGGLMVTPKTTLSTVDLTSATGVTGALVINTTATVLLPNLTTAGSVAITTVATGTVNMDKFTAAAPITVTGPAALSLPVWTGGALLTSSSAKTVTLAVNVWDVPATLPLVENLTIGAANNPVNLVTYTTLKTVVVNGKAPAAYNGVTFAALNNPVTLAAANAALTTVTLGGTIKAATITGAAALTSVTTTGIINSFEINGCSNTALTALALGHTYFVGGTGSVLRVIGNTKITALTTSTDFATDLTITGNTSLATLNAASYINKLYPGGAVNIAISGNKLSGVFTQAVAQTLTTPFAEATIVSSSLLTLKAYVAALYAGATLTVTMAVDLDDANGAAAGAPTLTSLMSTIAYPFGGPVSVINGVGAIDIAPEFTLVQ